MMLQASSEPQPEVEKTAYEAAWQLPGASEAPVNRGSDCFGEQCGENDAGEQEGWQDVVKSLGTAGLK